MRYTKFCKHKTKYSVLLWSLLLLLFIGMASFAAADDTLGTFSGRVWNDLDNNGLMDASEPGIEGVTMQLKREDTGEVLTALTGADGTYMFTGLPVDSYEFSVALPDSMLYARYRSDGELRSYLTGNDAEVYRNVIIRKTRVWTDINVGLVDSAILKGITYLDMNYNGNYDEGEPPYAGLKLQMIRDFSDELMQEIITGEDGAFYFNYLRTGTYRFRAIVPDDGSKFTYVPESKGVFSNLFEARTGRRENSVSDISVENNMVYDYYIGVALGAQISGTAFHDKNYSGIFDGSDGKISSITVQLIDSNGNITAHTSTGRNGEYTLTDVMPGKYTLRFARKDGYSFTKYRPSEADGNDAFLALEDDYGITEPIVIQMGEVLTDYNAGMVQSGTVSGVFFYDENDNGLMDKNEGGYTDGKVRLVSDDGEIDITQIINENGTYLFSGVVPTTYTLYYLLPEHAELAKVTKGGNTLAHQGLENAVSGLTVKAKKGHKQPLVGALNLGSFEGTAFEDLNANGTREDGEAALSGVTVTVTAASDANNSVSVITDGDGRYTITGLRPNEYTLGIELPEGLIFAGNIIASGIPLEATSSYSASILYSTLLRHTDNYIGVVAPASIQASAWLDENVSGAYDDGERSYIGLTYELYDELRQQAVASLSPDQNGNAIFTNIRPSTYTVSFKLPDDARPVSGTGSMAEAQGIMQQNGIVVHSGDSISGISCGLQCTTSIGGSVLAAQSSGIQPVANALVELYQAGDAQLLQSTQTDAEGAYRFDGLWPGDYIIEVLQPDGYVFIRPGDPAFDTHNSAIQQINDIYGTSAPISLAMAQDTLDIDVYLAIPAKVGSLVWLDENENGLIDDNEPTISGVSISLMQDGAAVYTTTSNEWGYYEFADVYPGNYILRAEAYPQLSITASNSALRIISSCLTLGDGSIAASDAFDVTSESVNFFYHLGYTLNQGETLPDGITEGSRQVWTR